MKKIIAIVFVELCMAGLSQAQDLSLWDVIKIAQDRSLPIVQSRNELRGAYWKYRNYKATLLPGLYLSSAPFSYNSSVVSEYDFRTNRYDFILQQTLNTDVRLFMSQNIPLTGGELFLSTSLGRLENFGDAETQNYNSAPLSIGLRQEIGGFNPFKWNKILEPLLYKSGRAGFALAGETVALRVTEYYFDVLKAGLDLEIARFNYNQSDTLLLIGRERAKIGTLTQDDVLELERDLLNARTERTQSLQAQDQARYILNIFLAMPADTLLQLTLPEALPACNVEAEKAMNWARGAHPDLMVLEQKLIEANQTVDKALRERRPKVTLNANFGLNRLAPELSEAYARPFDQLSLLNIGIDFPILDWGARKGQYELARSSLEVVKAETAQQRLEFERQLRQLVVAFRLQPEIVSQVQQSKDIAFRGFQITRRRFLLGNVDLIKLNTARRSLNAAQKTYLEALAEYWRQYYNLRTLTLHDIETGAPLELPKE